MDASFRLAQRTLQQWAPDLPALADAGPPLETARSAPEPPRLVSAPVIEGHALRGRRIDGDPTVGFAAFLDGTQRTHVLGYHDGLPLVFGTVAAVVRKRASRRLYTWESPLVARRVYLPVAHLPAGLVQRFAGAGYDVADTTAPDERGDTPTLHPFSLLDRAVHLVQEDRERAEQALAERWCASQGNALFIDGGVNKSEVVAHSPCAVGVVKSHRTLYVEGDALQRVCRLRRGERSSVFRIPSSRRTPVASWYLRVRDPAGHDPLWGLVRVEAADPAVTSERAEDLTARADLISRWILAEIAPLALPDGRWDKMVYGIRDCEEFLRAVC